MARLVGVEGVAACGDPSASPWQFFPMLLPTAEVAERFTAEAAARGMETRRYYVPALSSLPDVDRLGPCPVAEDLSTRMCCVPVYSDASAAESAELAAIFQASIVAALVPPSRPRMI